MNYVNISGTVKADAERRMIREGLSVMDFTLVVSGGDNERPTYVDCSAYGDDIVSGQLQGYVEQGESLEIEGRMSFRTYTDKRGGRRSGIVVLVDNIVEEDTDVD